MPTSRRQHWDTSDGKFDRQLKEKFPIGAHLPLSIIPYDMISVKCEFLKDNTKKRSIANKNKKTNSYSHKSGKTKYRKGTTSVPQRSF